MGKGKLGIASLAFLAGLAVGEKSTEGISVVGWDRSGYRCCNDSREEKSSLMPGECPESILSKQLTCNMGELGSANGEIDLKRLQEQQAEKIIKWLKHNVDLATQGGPK